MQPATLMSINIDRSKDSLMSLENHVKSNNPQAVLIQDMPKLKLKDLELNCQIIAPNYRQFFLMPIEDQGNKLHIHSITLVRDNIAVNKSRDTNGSCWMVGND